MLRGANAINLDTKGRIAIPTRYRDWLTDNCQGQFVCTIDFQSQNCLLLYPLHEWLLIENKLRGLSSTNPQERRIQRLILGHASECELDKSGRTLIAPTLRQHAKLDKKIMLVGQLNKFEIWDEEVWHQQVQQDLQSDMSLGMELSDSLKEFSF
ncbi:division/cell wall cluster transcriptional repressor MraZ [Psychromonas sp. 14N.309.X.WAT.B.A12]|uniref:division/cell wall cluster transcriptional repressor MraZ n=1 Tax=unclassified Psychromonas TaxID=2614957 RepID=UPI0025B11ADA|nr:division/cell wall cluster transcriptional repressor MraZ [Psychromonas sp. 14N.309.X.WAT.B.A12]MDN2663675.1 division/cell wall cluster transcriptional repressor MraZ [Psychromonas sp. 14N.309.X.WAT.B.A12]